jgi:hypothetical protein
MNVMAAGVMPESPLSPVMDYGERGGPVGHNLEVVVTSGHEAGAKVARMATKPNPAWDVPLNLWAYGGSSIDAEALRPRPVSVYSHRARRI